MNPLLIAPPHRERPPSRSLARVGNEILIERIVRPRSSIYPRGAVADFNNRQFPRIRRRREFIFDYNFPANAARFPFFSFDILPCQVSRKKYSLTITRQGGREEVNKRSSVESARGSSTIAHGAEIGRYTFHVVCSELWPFFHFCFFHFLANGVINVQHARDIARNSRSPSSTKPGVSRWLFKPPLAPNS